MVKAHKTVPEASKTQSVAKTALAFALVTLIAAGSGALHGLRGATRPDRPEATKTASVEPPSEARSIAGNLMRELPPIVATLAEPKNVWVRLETAIVLDRAALPEADRHVRDITGDVLAYVRTLSLPQLQGASGLHHLREDLNERAAIRSKGRVQELIIQTMVLQ